MSDSSPRLIGMVLENYMGLDLIEIEFDPDTHVFKVAGKNEQGKSRLIGAAPYALGVKGFTPEEPITRGRTTGRVILTYDAFTVERKVKKGQPTQLIVKDAEGRVINSPQKFLDSLMPPTVMNPTDFCLKYTDKQRMDFLLDLIGGREKLDALDTEAKAVYESRRITNRDVDTLKGKLSGYSESDEPEVAEVSISELLTERTVAQGEDDTLERRREYIRKAKTSVERYCEIDHTYSDKIRDLQNQIADIEAKITENNAAVDKMLGEITDQQAIIDAAPPSRVPEIEARMQELDRSNADARAIKERNALRAELRVRKAASEKATRRLNAIADEKIDILAAANIPIEGLTIEDQTIKINGLPWEQQSTAQGLLNAMRLVDMQAPKLRQMLIDLDHLDGDSKDVVRKFAEERGYLIFAEMVRDTPEQAVADGADVFMEQGKVTKLKQKTPIPDMSGTLFDGLEPETVGA